MVTQSLTELTEVFVSKESLTAKIQIMIEPSLIARIDDWRFERRIGSRSKAMRELLNIVLDDQKTKGTIETAISSCQSSNIPA